MEIVNIDSFIHSLLHSANCYQAALWQGPVTGSVDPALNQTPGSALEVLSINSQQFSEVELGQRGVQGLTSREGALTLPDSQGRFPGGGALNCVLMEE